MRDSLVIASFIAGLVPTLIFVIAYGTRTRWNESPAGRFLFTLAFTTAVSYTVSIATLLFPDYFNDAHGEWARIIIRFALAAVSWSLLFLFFRAQSSGRRKRRHRAVDEERENL